MRESAVDAYLSRIGARAPCRADAAALADLQERHLMTVPFENIDFHLGHTIELGSAALDKVVHRRRGGTCRELNGSAFPELLRALGYAPELLGSSVYRNGVRGVALGHTVIRVEAPEPWLVDVGFGAGSRHPLRLDLREPQTDPHGTFQFVDVDEGAVELLRDGEPVYRVETRSRSLADFRPLLWWFQTASDSPFARHLFCSLVTATGRVTLSGDTLIETVRGEKRKRVLGTEREVRETYHDVFGVSLDRMPPLPGRRA